ncbi:MAG: short-chain dehydrogenase [Ramlibacter sp.]|nr:short-chain dehydrogenase [Ramlibacter sp.]
MSTAVQGKTVLVTGARGGIGQALVKAFLEAGAAQVIAADRSEPAQRSGDPRVRHLVLDVTNAQAAEQAAAACDVDVIVNNAGANGNCGLFEGEADQARREMEVNYFGVLNMARAFAPAMKKKRGGALVQVLSFAALSNIPAMGSYSASKAAARSLTQALRAELGLFGVQVVGVYPRVVDTAMSAHLPIAKTTPEDVAQAVLAALAAGQDEVYPGNAAAAHEAFLRDPAAVERDNAKRLPRSSLAATEVEA